MSHSDRIRLLAAKPHWHEAWVCIAVMFFSASLMASGANQSWSVAAMFVASAVFLFRAIQPQRSYLELTPRGLEIAWGLHRSFVAWQDVSNLRLVTLGDNQFGGVAFTASARARDILGCQFAYRAARIDGVLRGNVYGISDWRLYQLMARLHTGNGGGAAAEEGPEPVPADGIALGDGVRSSRSTEPS